MPLFSRRLAAEEYIALEERAAGELRDSDAPSKSSSGTIWSKKAPVVIIGALALLMAFIHLGFALYLNHKPADGSPGPITQTWLLVVVALISNIFGIAIDMSLGGAFTQYLWRHLRSRFLKASTINDLFSMRGDIFSKTITGDIASVFKSVKESGAWALLMMTIILWSKPIFSPFISAAITVKLSPATIGPSSTQVPIFDAADVTGPLKASIQRLSPTSNRPRWMKVTTLFKRHYQQHAQMGGVPVQPLESPCRL
ncbi:MAG: hypothetical protein Q9157_006825 [Trypethelium eluteriae]